MSNYLAKAIAFIEENGDEVERARLAGLLGRARPEPKIVRTLGIRQNEDGGYPYGMIPGRPSAIISTTAGLQWMHDLHLTFTGFVERAVVYLLSVQRPDGAWEESPAVIKFDPPEHVRPGRAAARPYCTAIVTYWFARLGAPGHDAVARASAYLRVQRNDGWPTDEPVLTSVWVTAALALVDGVTSSIVSAGEHALSLLPPEAWTAERLAELLGAFAGARFAVDDPLVSWAIRRLRAAQRADGGWASDQTVDRDVDLSLRALGALLAFGISSP